jgi:hypothetical protein
VLGAPPPLISSASVFHRYPSCCSPVFLIPAAHHQRDRVIGSGRCSALASSHGARIQTSRSSSVSRMTGMAFGWIGSTTAFGDVVVDLMRAWNRFGFRSALTLELGPDAGEAGQRPIVIDREPDDVLFLSRGSVRAHTRQSC